MDKMYKDKNEKWNHFERIAIQAVYKGQTMNYSGRYIHLTIDPTFEYKTTLQFEWAYKQVNCFRTTWESDKDRVILYSYALENELPEPTFLVEKGLATTESFIEIMNWLKTNRISNYIEEYCNNLKDGEEYTLTIGYLKSSITYKWHYLPENWNNLLRIMDKLLGLTNTIQPLKKY